MQIQIYKIDAYYRSFLDTEKAHIVMQTNPCPFGFEGAKAEKYDEVRFDLFTDRVIGALETKREVVLVARQLDFRKADKLSDAELNIALKEFALWDLRHPCAA